MSYLYVAALEFEVFIFFFWNKFKVVKGWQIIKGERRKTNISKFKCVVCIYPAPKERGCSVLPLCCYLSVIKNFCRNFLSNCSSLQMLKNSTHSFLCISYGGIHLYTNRISTSCKMSTMLISYIHIIGGHL